MTDIVERLRRDATCTTHHEAADEIERLRITNQGLLALVDVITDAVAGHQERAEMLRTALRGLLADTQHVEHDCKDADCPVALARAALTEAGYG